jgi:hypothetical protein
MTVCSVCLHTLPSELGRCPYCESELEVEGREVVNEEIHWEIVRTVSTEIEATLIAGRLRAHGIPAFVLSQVDSTRGFTIGALAVAKVFVPESSLDEAKQLPATSDGLLPDDDPEQESSTDPNHSTE